MTTAPNNAPQPDGLNAVGIESSALFGLLRQFRDPVPSDITADRIIAYCEQFGLGWSLDHTGRLIEARIWDWPHVLGRYRPHTVEPLANMLWMAMRNAFDSLPNNQGVPPRSEA